VLTFEIEPKIRRDLPSLLPACFEVHDFAVSLGPLDLDVFDEVHFVSYLLGDFLEVLDVVDLLAYLLDQFVHELSLHQIPEPKIHKFERVLVKSLLD
jgi:hypothetical protein